MDIIRGNGALQHTPAPLERQRTTDAGKLKLGPRALRKAQAYSISALYLQTVSIDK